MTALLQAEGLRKRFGGLVAVADVSLSVGRGQLLGLFGPNGAGKTTTFNLIAGALRPDAGRIVFDGADITAKPGFVRARDGIGRTFQTVRPFRELTVFENLLAAVPSRGSRATDADAPQRAHALLRQVALEERAHHPAGELTLGMLKRLEVARALMTAPRLLLLDEPLAGLSEDEALEVLRLVGQVKQDAAVILVEHNVRLAMPACDHAVVMDAGAVLASGAPDDVRRDKRVIDAYLGEDTGSEDAGGEDAESEDT